MTDPEDDIDFVTLHNILYYIYTGTVNLHVPQIYQDDYLFPEGYPSAADPYLLFRNADKFLLPSLKNRCYNYLKNVVTPEIVAERLFHKDCAHHGDLKTFYLEYVIANYDKVKSTEGWKKAVCSEDENSLSVMKYRTSLLYEISQKVVGSPAK
jgi:hypothetical protein